MTSKSTSKPSQGSHFFKFLANAPLMLIGFSSLLLTAFILINKAFPDGLALKL